MAAHRHTPEMEQTLSRLSGTDVRLTFVPHLSAGQPWYSGYLFARLRPGTTLAQLREAYRSRYDGEFSFGCCRRVGWRISAMYAIPISATLSACG